MPPPDGAHSPEPNGADLSPPSGSVEQVPSSDAPRRTDLPPQADRAEPGSPSRGDTAPPPGPAGVTQPRRTHPVTPLVHAGRLFPVLLLIGVGLLQGVLADLGLVVAIIGLIAVALILAILTAGFQYLAWQRTTFWFDDQGDFRVASGVITRRERRLQLSRLQGVEVVQPLLARVFGMAEITIEVAGIGDSRARVRYLTLEDGHELRNEVIARAAGLHPQSGAAPQRPLVTVPAQDLLVSLLLRGSTVGLLAITAALVVTTIWTSGVGGLFFLIIGGLPLFIVFIEFSRFYDFTVAESADGLRLRSGLFQVQSQTIPPGRVQAVEFVQSILWRQKDWVRVQLNVAGMRTDEEGQQQAGLEHVLLPVAPYDVALSVVGHVLPGVDARSIPRKPSPDRAARRAWIQFRQLGVGVDDRVLLTARGRFVNRLAVVPHARCQSVRVTQGPWQRWLRLATMHVDSVPGPVRITALHRDVAEARALADEQNVRALQALRAAGPQRWMQDPTPTDDA